MVQFTYLEAREPKAAAPKRAAILLKYGNSGCNSLTNGANAIKNDNPADAAASLAKDNDLLLAACATAVNPKRPLIFSSIVTSVSVPGIRRKTSKITDTADAIYLLRPIELKKDIHFPYAAIDISCLY